MPTRDEIIADFLRRLKVTQAKFGSGGTIAYWGGAEEALRARGANVRKLVLGYLRVWTPDVPAFTQAVGELPPQFWTDKWLGAELRKLLQRQLSDWLITGELIRTSPDKRRRPTA